MIWREMFNEAMEAIRELIAEIRALREDLKNRV